MLYLFIEYLHVLGAVVILGTGTGIAFFMLMAHGPGDVHREPPDEQGRGADGRPFPGAATATGRAYREEVPLLPQHHPNQGLPLSAMHVASDGAG